MLDCLQQRGLCLNYASMTFVGPDNVKTILLGNGVTETVYWRLAHELARAAGAFDRRYNNLEERWVITGAERSVNRMLGEMPRFDHSENVNKGPRGISRTSVYSPVIGVCP